MSSEEDYFDEDELDDEDLDSPNPALAAIILAAGEGSRFDGEKHKLLSTFRGKPLILWSVEAAMGARFDDIYVVMGAVDLSDGLSKILTQDITLIQNDSWESGQGCSLNVGIECARRDGYRSVVIGLGDAPLVPSLAWEDVAYKRGDVVTATYEVDGRKGFRSPPVKLEDHTWESLALSGDEGARLLMKKRPELVVEVACEGNPADIDTLQDLKNLG